MINHWKFDLHERQLKLCKFGISKCCCEACEKDLQISAAVPIQIDALSRDLETLLFRGISYTELINNFMEFTENIDVDTRDVVRSELILLLIIKNYNKYTISRS